GGDSSPKIEKEPIIAAIDALKKYQEPSLLAIPDTVLLSESDCSEVQKKMLAHCGNDMQSRFSILDVYHGNKERTPSTDTDIIERFRENIGSNNLQWGAAYYPWLHTTVVNSNEVGMQYISNLEGLKSILTNEVNADKSAGLIDDDRAKDIQAEIDKIGTDANASNLHHTFLAVSPLYKQILKEIQEKLNLLPTAGAIAGVYAMTDNNVGVFQSPANVSLGSVIKPTVNISADEQEDLNIPLDGKAINAIRTFPGKGTLVWGARTLDGNSQDWRYVSVRRTVIMIEQTIKQAAEAYVFEPNNAATWMNLKAMISNYLNNVWAQGGLAGATAEDAFSVAVGLGSTMTTVDVLDGLMRISVKVAVTRPAEFILITFVQQMQKKKIIKKKKKNKLWQLIIIHGHSQNSTLK
ncbi:MAG: phage tail sheath family protein, partial [Saprospiraceae bacterium]